MGKIRWEKGLPPFWGAGAAKTRGQDKTGAVDLRVSQLRDLGLSSGRDFPDFSGPWGEKGVGETTRASKSGFLPQQLPLLMLPTPPSLNNGQNSSPLSV